MTIMAEPGYRFLSFVKHSVWYSKSQAQLVLVLATRSHHEPTLSELAAGRGVVLG